jgi:hypothetical protein
MTFPSKCQVFRAKEGERCVVTVFGYGSGCVATGKNWKEADRKAEIWVMDNLKRQGLLGALGLLDLALEQLCDALSTSLSV